MPFVIWPLLSTDKGYNVVILIDNIRLPGDKAIIFNPCGKQAERTSIVGRALLIMGKFYFDWFIISGIVAAKLMWQKNNKSLLQCIIFFPSTSCTSGSSLVSFSIVYRLPLVA